MGFRQQAAVGHELLKIAKGNGKEKLWQEATSVTSGMNNSQGMTQCTAKIYVCVGLDHISNQWYINNS